MGKVSRSLVWGTVDWGSHCVPHELCIGYRLKIGHILRKILHEIPDGYSPGPVRPQYTVIVDQALLPGSACLLHKRGDLTDEVIVTTILVTINMEKVITIALITKPDGGPDQIALVTAYRSGSQFRRTIADLPAKFTYLYTEIFTIRPFVIDEADDDELIVGKVECHECLVEL